MNGCSDIVISDSAQDDLLAGYWFYERQQAGIGTYFLDSLSADIDALLIYAGVQTQDPSNRLFRMLASRFPYAIYYTLEASTATVVAVLDTRQDPEWIRSKL
ncbi:MAG: type II toxin-antitoxin system RelE/ParE family toxin [Burkholderiales bacterium]